MSSAVGSKTRNEMKEDDDDLHRIEVIEKARIDDDLRRYIDAGPIDRRRPRRRR
jgi:hypothetical protein